jgi:hypothetical protein
VALDVWIASSVRRTVVTLVTGVVVLGIGVLSWLYIDARTSARVADGRPTEAQIVLVRWPKIGTIARVQEVTVSYSLDERQHEATLMAVFGDGTYREGQHVTVYADPDDPAKVATADGFASEGWGMQIPVYICTAGIIAILLGSVSRLIYLVRRRRASES